MSINLVLDTLNKLDDLIYFVYQSVKIKYVYIFDEDGDKIKYYQRLNKWGGHDNIHENKCDSYFDCELNDRIGTNQYINYKLEYKPDARCFEDKKRRVALSKSELDILSGNALDKIYLQYPKDLILHNKPGFNYDHKGSDHTKLILDFDPNAIIRCNNGQLSFEDFADACFRIKSHKFDFWYELYCGVDLLIDSNDKLIADIDFDHGS